MSRGPDRLEVEMLDLSLADAINTGGKKHWRELREPGDDDHHADAHHKKHRAPTSHQPIS